MYIYATNLEFGFAIYKTVHLHVLSVIHLEGYEIKQDHSIYVEEGKDNNNTYTLKKTYMNYISIYIYTYKI